VLVALFCLRLYRTKYVSVNNFQITARDALGDPQPAVTTSASINPGLGDMPVFRLTNEQAIVYVYFPNHGYQAGDIFPVIDAVDAGTVRLLGNYTVLNVGDENGANTTSQFSIGADNTATKATPIYFSGDGTVASVRLPLGYGVTRGDSITIENCPTAGYNATNARVVDVSTTSTYTEVKYLNATTTVVPSGLQSCTLLVTYALSNAGFAEHYCLSFACSSTDRNGLWRWRLWSWRGSVTGVIPPSPSAATTATSGTGSVVTITYNSTKSDLMLATRLL